MKTQVEPRGDETRMMTESEHGMQLHRLSRALQDVHRGLLEISRERYELENRRCEARANCSNWC
jgi:hypothetical protein